MKVEKKKTLLIVIGIFVLFLCYRYWGNIVQVIGTAFGAAFPLILGCIIAYAVNILMSFYENIYVKINFKKHQKLTKGIQKGRRATCMVLAFVSIIVIIFLIIIMVVPELVSAVTVLIETVPYHIEKLIGSMDGTSEIEILVKELYDKYIGSYLEVQKMLSGAINVLQEGVTDVVGSVFKTVTGIFSGAVTLLIGAIFSIYLLTGKEKLNAQSKKILKLYFPNIYDRVIYIFGILNESFHSFIVGQCIEAVILGSLCALGMLIFQFPYALMVGVLIGFTALIPVAGAYIGAIVGALMMLTVSPLKAVLFIVFIVVLQQLEGNLIYPKVVGESIGLPGMWVLAAVTIGGGVMGIVGMLLGVPLTASLYKILKNNMNKREMNRGKC